LVGIGINVLAGPHELPPGATSILVATGVAPAPDDVFNTVLDRFESAYVDFVNNEGRPSLAAWRARAALLGEMVTIEDEGRSLTGVLAGIDDDGGLLIEKPERQIHKVVAGDLVRGPRQVAKRR
jgi:BirA family biotin operon repressor/biotin-[acetyl-CoA-carboxylase] ligase